jgi:hypothetical protein
MLAVCAVLSGGAVPHTGLVTPMRHSVLTGINVLRVDTTDPIAAIMESVLLHPIRTRKTYLSAAPLLYTGLPFLGWNYDRDTRFMPRDYA